MSEAVRILNTSSTGVVIRSERMLGIRNVQVQWDGHERHTWHRVLYTHSGVTIVLPEGETAS